MTIMLIKPTRVRILVDEQEAKGYWLMSRKPEYLPMEQLNIEIAMDVGYG